MRRRALSPLLVLPVKSEGNRRLKTNLHVSGHTTTVFTNKCLTVQKRVPCIPFSRRVLFWTCAFDETSHDTSAFQHIDGTDAEHETWHLACVETLALQRADCL